MADRCEALARHPSEFVKIPLVKEVVMRCPNRPNEDVSGSLVMTGSHMIFQEPSGRRETWLVFHLIQSVSSLPSESRGHPLAIRCKHFLRLTFIIPSAEECTAVMETITAIAQPAMYDYLYAFCYPHHKQQSGWSLFNPRKEFARMGLPNSFWTESLMNESYGLCATYPSVLYFPASCSNDVIEGSAKFRSKGRLPTLSYFYEPKGTSLSRCSQPLVGLKKRSQDDEDLMDAIAKTTPDKKKIYIIDVRPRVNALGNRIAGKGFEDEGKYKSAEFYFIGIHNIHVMRESLEKLLEATESPKMSTFLCGLDSSGWMGHIKDILDASKFIARALCGEGRSVVVHCSDGWDRTSQTCSLAKMMIDPHYRTLHGFITLLEQEWLSFGHRFTQRLGLLSTSEVRDFSPVFSQFLDCTWQLKQQFPTAFQFNEHFLVTLHQEVYACQFGTFIGSCERERSEVLKLHKRTASLWDHILEKTHLFSDPLYDPNTSDVVLPKTDIRQLKFWRGLYCQFSSAVIQKESVQDAVLSLSNETKALHEHIEYLEKVLSDTKAKLSASDEGEASKEVDPLIKMPVAWACPRLKQQCYCGKPFSFIERRLNCQHCGQLTCDECLTGDYKVQWSLSSTLRPACQPCRRKLAKQSI